ncbi:hypothetical protein FGO68_gene10144 [Halteria grandinella]|uniref:Transmembrane protein n=1 Tax=Halteria grandinella TaxID=5974 RepID=A0A8J8NIR4_HALGN|nr:hypothetical protein FGO68_gene10144 [Halteria grandinella]
MRFNSYQQNNMSSKDFEELESDLLKDNESYEKNLKEKMQKRMYVSNFLESKDQAKVSGMGGAMFMQRAESKQEVKSEGNPLIRTYMRNLSQVMVPIFVTALCGTVTYPIAVRIARSKRLFKLRNFYAIHIAIAPFLAFIHSNIFSGVYMYMKIKIREIDYKEYLESNPRERDQFVATSNEEFGIAYNKLKKRIVEKDYAKNAKAKWEAWAKDPKKFEKERKESQGLQKKQLEELKIEDYKLAYQLKTYLDNRI